MIVLLTILISIFIITNVVALIVIMSDNFYDDDIIYEISKWFLMIEMSLIISGVVILLSYVISTSIVCNATNNDYKGCPVEMEVSGNNE